MEKVNVCHRIHLRTICNIHYPGVISNRELYRRCKALPMTEHVRKSSWTLFGHILRMDENSPASLALRFAIESSTRLQGRRGRPHTNLLSNIQADLRSHNLSLNGVDDLVHLKTIASDRTKWKTMFKYNVNLI